MKDLGLPRDAHHASDEYLDIDLSVFDFDKYEAERLTGFASGKFETGCNDDVIAFKR